ncbi:protein disabled isoform X2 [Palaemon carinicauda]|uniref:protein disabled isoform X2 n=1 Tax=Palaemon carinicauda TaxID=392227 RepID=UPI0035B5D171
MSTGFPRCHSDELTGGGDAEINDSTSSLDPPPPLDDDAAAAAASAATNQGCGPDGCGRGGGVGGVKEGAPPLPSRPPPFCPPPPLSSSDQDLRDGWARLSWVAPPPPRQTKQPLPHPHHTTFHLHLAKNKKLVSQSSLPVIPRPQTPPNPTSTTASCAPNNNPLGSTEHLSTTTFSAFKQYPTHYPTHHLLPPTNPVHPTHHKLQRPFAKDSTPPSSSSSSTLSLHHHHQSQPEDEVLCAESRLVTNSCSGSSAGSLNSTAGTSSANTTANTSSNTRATTSMSSSTGAAASYSTIRRGLKATTSKLVNATSTIRRPTAASISSDRTSGTEKNDPHRFVEGISFKGKLIGVLEVAEARGDRMCQEALAELKMAVRAAGEHKQRIVVTVAMDGIRLRDERSSDCLYHHPVHKISFIAQDMTDTRAFGYIFGSPDAGHKFFGIKTEKAATQVVIAMRDLFQVVFEIKKKEIELARKHLEEGRERGVFGESSFTGLYGSNGDSGIVSASLTSGAGGAIADLLDLQSELSSLQKGLSEISQQRAQQNQKEGEQFDPFGDSFKPSFKTTESSKPRITASTAPTPAPLAPPPFSGRTRHDSSHSAQQKQQAGAGAGAGATAAAAAAAGTDQTSTDEFAKFPVSFPDVTKSPPTTQPSAEGGQSLEDRYAAFKEFRTDNESFNSFSESRFCEGQESQQASGASSLHQPDDFDVQWSKASFDENALGEESKESHYDVFTELDPLGTGKNRPYVDKRDFFSEMRKPVKRVLRELGDGEASAPCSPRTQPGMIPPEVSALVASTSLYATTPRSSSVTASQPATSTNTTPVHGTSLPSQQFAESFSPPDSFGQEDFQFHQTSEKDFYEASNISSGFADFNTFPNDSPRSQRSEMSSSIPDEPPPPLPCGPLTVALPPESFRDSPPPFSPPPVPRSPARMASGPGSPQLTHARHSPLPRARLTKQMMVSSTSISPKTLPRSHKFRNDEASFDSDWDNRESHHRSFASGDLTPPTPPQQQSDGGLSPRPRPRSHLTKQLSASSATLSLRPSSSRYGEIEQFSSPEGESRPFPTDDLNLSYEEAPKPPPRPAHIEPPPLPPKRQPTHVTLRPPPRPPPSSDPHYNYINEYDSSPDEANTPPIPIPARKPRYSDNVSRPAFIPSRATKPPHSDGFQFPKPSVSPTHEMTGAVPKSSRESTPSKSSTPGKSPRLTQKSTASVDLANTSLDQLASSLNMPVDQLARMTVVELAACLAQLQLRQGGDLENQARGDAETYGHSADKSGRRSRGPSREQSRDRFAFEDDEMFAEFDAQFPKSPVEPPEYTGAKEQKPSHAVGAPVSEDRYAVFRELTTVSKQRSVFDENFLTPQNSMEEEVSEVSSGTFKANFDGDLRDDSLERKSSLSDDGDTAELGKDKNWQPPNHDLECVTVFRSPEISEYDNFEPTFDAKFDDDFSAATMSERSITPVNSPTLRRGSPRSFRQQSESYKSPFTDDFSKQPVGRSRVESDTSFASFDDNFVPPSDADKYSSLQELSIPEKSKQDSIRKSPFADSFVDAKGRENMEDGRYSAGYGDNSEKYDDPFTTLESKPRSSSRSSSEMMSKTPDFDNSLQAPVDHLASKRKSPFDDDFTNRGDRYEVLKEVESEREPSLEGEVSRLTRQSDPRGSPFDDSWHGSHRNTPYEDQKSTGSLHSTHDDHKSIPPESPFEDDFNCDSRKASGDHGRLSRSGSENRKSPFGDSYTPPASGRVHRSRGPSRLSVGSEGSDVVRHSPFEDNFSSIIGSVAEEVTFDNAFPSLPQDITTSSEAEESDPFSVKVNKTSATVESGQSDMQFADFEHAFQQSDKGESEQVPESHDQSVDKSEVDNEEVIEDLFPDDETDFKVSARYIAPTSTDMKKSDSVSIFRRNSDPFADDFFCAEGENGQVPTGKNDGDPFWEEPFDNFSFPKDQ